MKYNSTLDLIGNTPLLLLANTSKKYNCNIYVKLEKYNLTQSIKDRAVKEMILSAIKEKKINKDTTIIEATSGNTGIALASICAYLSLKCIIVLPSNSNIERIKLIKAYGANIIYSKKEEKMKGAIKKAKLLAKQIDNSFYVDQFNNINNEKAHYENTAKEIIKDLPELDAFFVSYGSYGTINGCAKALKEHNSNIKVHKVILSNKNHSIPGIYSNSNINHKCDKFIDKIDKVVEEKAYNIVKEIAFNDGVFIGLSSGVNIAACLKYTKQYQNIVVIASDGGERYLSNEKLYVNLIYEKEEIIKDLKNLYNNFFIIDDLDNIFLIKYNVSKGQLLNIKNKLIKDAIFINDNDPSSLSKEYVIKSYNSFFAIFTYRIAHLIYKKFPLYSKIMSEYAHQVSGIDIHPSCKIGTPFSIDHGSCIVIGQSSIIGNNVRLYHNVTLGAKSLNNPNLLVNKKRHPTIKDNVVIYSNVTILGGKTIIGNNVIIGSGITLFDSVEDNTIVYLKDNKIIYRKRNL